MRASKPPLYIFLYLIFVGNAYCVPSQITIDRQSLIDGNIITVQGEDFGAGDSSPCIWDNFEEGINGTSISSYPARGTWSLISNPTPSLYSTSFAHSGDQSAVTPSHHTGYANIRFNGLENATRIYWSFWFRFNISGVTGFQTKLMQLWGNGPDQCDYGPGVMSGGFSDSWFASYNIASGDDCTIGKIQKSYGFTPAQDTWHYMEMILERSSDYGVADGTIIIRIDNRDVYSHSGDILTRLNEQDWRSALFFYGFTNDNGEGSLAIDDAYINDSWSRIVMGNDENYSQCTSLNMQPANSWSDTMIKFTVNTGAFKEGNTAYLFVIDSDGNVSDGFPVTIGENSGVPAPGAPAVPVNLRAE